MTNDRFISLLTKELCEELTHAEAEELALLLRENKAYRDQKELLKQYWEKDRVEYEANAAMFKKVTDKIRAEERRLSEGSSKEESERISDRHITSHSAGDADPVYEPLAPAPAPYRRFSRTFWYSAAATIVLVIGLVTLYHQLPVHKAPKTLAISWLHKTTQPTKKWVLTLVDGTIVTLNAATTLKYPERFDDSTREVYLDGEAYFDVAKDARHPFLIHAGKMNIRVLGTSFNVKSYQNELLSEATLIRGSIEVTLNDRPSDRFILKPREKLIIQNNTVTKRPVNAAAGPLIQDSAGKSTRYALTNLTYFPNTAGTVVETSWVEDKLVFSDKDFAQLSGQLERWYGMHIEFENEQVKAYRFTGFFEKETLPQALDVLKMIEHFNYRIKNSTVYIY